MAITLDAAATLLNGLVGKGTGILGSSCYKGLSTSTPNAVELSASLVLGTAATVGK